MITVKRSSGLPSPIFKVRAVLYTIFFTAILIPSLYQQSLDFLWDYLQSFALYQWSTFETIWTVFSYSIIETSFLLVFVKHPEWRLQYGTNRQDQGAVDVSNEYRGKYESTTPPSTSSRRNLPRGMRRPTRRKLEALTYILPLVLMDLTMIKKFADVPLSAMLLSGNYDVSRLIQSSESLTNSTNPSTFKAFGSHRHATFLVPTLHNFTLSSPLQTHRALPHLAPSSRRLALELATSFIIYDALFFLFHLALHTLTFLRPFHAPHHSHSIQLQPQITNKLSIFERLGLVLLANFSLNIIGAHVLTRTLFIPIFVWLLVEIHSGLELPWGYEKILPGGWGGGAAKHARHHVTGKGGLEPFFGWWDRLIEKVLGKDRIYGM